MKLVIETRTSEDYFKCFSAHLKVYLLHCNAFDLFIKHLIYFFALTYNGTYWDIEYLFVCIYGLIQSLLLISNLALDRPSSLFVIALQFVMLNLFALIQFPFGMDVWDHKHRLIGQQMCPQFVKFLVLDMFMATTLGYLVSKRKITDESIFSNLINDYF